MAKLGTEDMTLLCLKTVRATVTLREDEEEIIHEKEQKNILMIVIKGLQALFVILSFHQGFSTDIVLHVLQALFVIPSFEGCTPDREQLSMKEEMPKAAHLTSNTNGIKINQVNVEMPKEAEFRHFKSRHLNVSSIIPNFGDTISDCNRRKTENFINNSSKPADHCTSAKKDNAIIPDNDRLLCKVCYMNELSIVFLPCSHMVACRRCAARLKTCPVCRSGIKEALPANLHE